VNNVDALGVLVERAVELFELASKQGQRMSVCCVWQSPSRWTAWCAWTHVFQQFVRRNRSSSASNYAYSYTFLRRVVCLSVVCHIRATCLNYCAGTLVGPVTHCVGPSWPLRRRGDFRVESQPKHAIANCSPTVSPMLSRGEYKRGVRDSVFCQVNLVLVSVLMISVKVANVIVVVL